MQSDASTQALEVLSRFLVSESSLGETLLQVSQITTEAMPNAAMAGITMLGDDGRPKTDVFTDKEAPEMDSAQYESGRGPCLDSWWEARVVRLDDMEKAKADYPEFAQAAQDHGINSTISLPLIAGNQGIGALNLYSRAPAGFSTEDEQVGRRLAGAAAIVLANAKAYWEASQLNQQLSEAMTSRAVIEQAKGMLMARSPQLSADDAFDLLRQASQRENVKLREIAQRIVEPGATAPPD